MKSACAILLVLVAIMAVKAAVLTKKNKKLIRIPFREVRITDPKLRRSMAALSNRNVTFPELRRRDTGLVSVDSFDDLLWIGEIALGAPSQMFQVIFDTASSITWVPDLTCGDSCKELSMYNGAASNTFDDLGQHADFIYGGSGLTVSGTWTIDVLTLTDQMYVATGFVRANVVPDMFSVIGASGIVGLGFTFPNSIPVLMDNLNGKSLLDDNVVSCRLIKDQEGTGESLGELLFGGVDQEFVDGDIQYTHIIQSPDGGSYWIIPVDDMQIAGKSLTQKGIAGVNTAVSLSFVSDSAAASLYAGIEGAEQNPDKGWIAPMPFPSDVSFVIGGRTFTIPASDMLTKEQVGDKYVCTIQGGANDIWNLGTVFIKNHYLVFNFGTQSIGIGKRSDY